MGLWPKSISGNGNWRSALSDHCCHAVIHYTGLKGLSLREVHMNMVAIQSRMLLLAASLRCELLNSNMKKEPGR